jgi:hypothetical protein
MPSSEDERYWLAKFGRKRLPYQLDIWAGGKKVLNIEWDGETINMVSFRPGVWEGEFLGLVEARPGSSALESKNSITTDALSRSPATSELPARLGHHLRKPGGERPPDVRSRRRLPEPLPRGRWPRVAPFLRYQPSLTARSPQQTPIR